MRMLLLYSHAHCLVFYPSTSSLLLKMCFFATRNVCVQRKILYRLSRVPSTNALSQPCHSYRSYFTNTDSMKREDPYHQLGLEYGTAPSIATIKSAFRQQAARLHPDVNKTDSPATAQRKFQDLQKAYNTLVKVHSNLNGISQEKTEEWQLSVWRNGDRLAVNRTDVAGVLKRRPAPPAERSDGLNFGFFLGHPSGKGQAFARGEYLSGGETSVSGIRGKPSSSVGRGLNQWVTPKEYIPWNGAATKNKMPNLVRSNTPTAKNMRKSDTEFRC